MYYDAIVFEDLKSVHHKESAAAAVGEYASRSADTCGHCFCVPQPPAVAPVSKSMSPCDVEALKKCLEKTNGDYKKVSGVTNSFMPV